MIVPIYDVDISEKNCTKKKIIIKKTIIKWIKTKIKWEIIGKDNSSNFSRLFSWSISDKRFNLLSER